METRATRERVITCCLPAGEPKAAHFGDFASLPTVHTIEDRDAISRMEGEGGPAVETDDAKQDAHGAVKELLGAVRT